ncbi:hypothetical protein QCD70_05480 [Agreia sp. PsM10]|uniref:hypothetical protein n=1 Tax=Agreia sp. PsM10 TaxID=3030533 RepID=UPI00263A5068|nr:hypothetical protein [Agreia sp. PsM10]MDN4639691.1 hypothetical protein [Agreia sp. PsM10]
MTTSTLAIRTASLDTVAPAELELFAAAIGMDEHETHSILNGKTPPNAQFIASVLATWPVTFSEVFEVVFGDDVDE